MRKRTITPAMFHILVVLSSGPRHGYGIMAQIEATEGRPLGPATLYRSIKQLLEMGLIEEVAADEDRRRSYRLTRSGEAVAAEEAARLDNVLEVARETGLLDALPRPGVTGG